MNYYANDIRFEPINIDEVMVQHVTDKALKCENPEGDEFWIPKSQIHRESEITEKSKKGDTGILVIPRWLAIEKGLVDE